MIGFINSNSFRNRIHILDQPEHHWTQHFERLLKSKLCETFEIAQIDKDENDVELKIDEKD